MVIESHLFNEQLLVMLGKGLVFFSTNDPPYLVCTGSLGSAYE